MGKHDDESIWDILMRPASMDYNGDGVIDDFDRYIELDHLDEALGQGKYDYYNDPYVIAQRERELEQELEDDDCSDGESDEDDSDVEDSEDYEADSGEYGDNTDNGYISLSFLFHDSSEDERKKFPTTGIWQYYDLHEWKFLHALYTFDEKLKEDCGTTYDKEEERIGTILNEIYQFDRERAIADWDWLLKTFPAEILNSTNDYAYDEPFSCRLGVCVLSLLYRYGDNARLTEYIKQDYVFDYIVVQSAWEKHNYFYLSKLLLCCAYNCDELFIKCYETVLKTQKDCYSKKDLAEVWDSFFCNIEWENVSEKLKNYIKNKLTEIGDFGKSVLNTIAEKEEEIGEHRRWEEEERLEAEQEAAEAEERRLQQEREAAERAERERQIKILEETSEPLSTKILSGELFDEAYMGVNQQFEYCFGSSRGTYDTVARYLLGKNGGVKDINKDLQVGVISSRDIKNIFMLTSIGNDILNFNHIKYRGKTPSSESEKKRFEINAPIIEYICKYCYAAKLMQLEEYGVSKSIYYYQSPELKRAYNCYRDCLQSAREEAKAIFNKITGSGEVKVSWVEEKRLFTYAQLNFPDAVYKYSPLWSESLCFDVYIPSLNLIIEYRQELKDGANPAEVERYNAEVEKFNKKRELCEKHGIAFAEWSADAIINEANFLQFVEKFK